MGQAAAGEISADEHERRWQQLADLNLAQQLARYPPDYVRADPRPDRMLETVIRFEEDLTDTPRVYRPTKNDGSYRCGDSNRSDAGARRGRGPGDGCPEAAAERDAWHFSGA